MFKAIAVPTALILILSSSSAHAEEGPPEAPPAADAPTKTKSPLLAAGLNFFIPGAGYLYNGEKPLYVSLPLIAGAAGLTYLENFHKYGDSDETLLEADSTAFAIMFSTVFVINTALAIDAYREAKAINRGSTRRVNVGAGPISKDGYGLSLSGRF